MPLLRLASPLSRSVASRLALALAFAAVPAPAAAVEPLHQYDVVLLQSGAVIEQRVAGGADAMGDYLKRLGAAATQAMQANPQQIPASGFIVIALRPGGQSHTWFDFKPALSPQTSVALARAVESVAALPVASGDIVFALRVGLWGAREPTAYAPAPQEWRDAAKAAGHRLELDTLIEQTWPR